MPWPGINQRNFPRIEASLGIRIVKDDKSVIRTKTKNLSYSGTCVVLSQQLEKLSTVRLELDLSSDQSPIRCNGRIAWLVRSQEPVSHKVSYDIGIEFLKLDPEAKDQIHSYVQSHS